MIDQTYKAQYAALQTELQAIEKATGAYLADESVDIENVLEGKSEELKAEFHMNYLNHDHSIYKELYQAACMAAGMRSEDAGIDINALIGRNIY